jgi:hypothetical protein
VNAGLGFLTLLTQTEIRPIPLALVIKLLTLTLCPTTVQGGLNCDPKSTEIMHDTEVRAYADGKLMKSESEGCISTV